MRVRAWRGVALPRCREPRRVGGVTAPGVRAQNRRSRGLYAEGHDPKEGEGCARIMRRYVPATELESEVEALYEGVRIPAALKRRLGPVLRTEVAERERHRAEAAEFLARGLRQLANEREKILRAYYADAIDVAILKREQARINAEVAEAESQLADDGERLAQAKQIIDVALDLAKDCATRYRKARPDVRQMWNRAFFRVIRVRDGAIASFTYEEPFASLLGSHKGSMVDLAGRCVNQVPLLDALRRQSIA